MQASCQSPLFSAEATSTPLSVSQRAVVQLLMGSWQIMCQSQDMVMERQQLTARTSPCPATAACPCQNKSSACHAQIFAHPEPPTHLSSAFLYLPAPSIHILLPAATGVGVQQQLSERATGNFGKGKGQRSCEEGKHSRSTDCWVLSQIFHLHTSSVLA